ncbi:MAG: tetratricopeptide repeat protein [Candidatus Aminicenantales bacterium]
MPKKVLTIAALAALVVLQAAFAWNARLCWRAKAVATDPDEKIRLLHRAEAVFPWNDAVPFELGKVYFERGAEALGDPAARDALFRRASESFLRSLRLNPGSPAAHFELGQTLLYASYAALPTPLAYFDEYRRAAELTGHNSQIHFDAGKVLLGNWDALAPGEKDFVVGLLKSSLPGKGEERLLDLLETWNLTTRDPGLIDRILPDDAATLRTYARFLGERSLLLDARQTALARAEAIEVARAGSELDRGRREADSFRMAAASARSAAALEALGSVKFYQTLVGRELFDPREFARINKTARRLLAMARIEETRSLADEDGTIAAYLDAEDEFTALGEFETFIKERGLLDEAGTDSPFKDLRTLAFRMGLDFKLNRYRDIARVGSLLTSSSLVIAPSGKPSYARILRLIGESDLKLDSVYEAGEFYRKAREAAPGDLEVLLGLERCYSRLSDQAKADEVRQAIGRLIGPGEIDLGGRVIGKGETVKIDLVTSGGPRTIRLEFSPAAAGGRPLVSVFLNGRVAWEKYGDTGSAEFTGTLGAGPASLEISAVSEPVVLGRIVLAGAATR